MRNFALTFRLLIAFMMDAVLPAPNAWSWNEQGHFLVARLAWLELSAEDRAKVSEILRAHPHYEEYLTAERPVGVPTAEWAFLRAAYWPDWIRSNHSEEFSKPAWHYVPAAFVPPRSKLPAPEIHRDGPNVVNQIPLSLEGLRSATGAERAVHLCWLIHLLGDIHQPLHNCSLFDETFPQGDRGGNLSLVRIETGEPVRLHVTWDNLFGELTSLTALEATIGEIRELEKTEGTQMREEISARRTTEDWSKEGYDLACRHAYLQGDLVPVNSDLNPEPALVPALSEAYMKNAIAVAKRSAAKGGHRLADAIHGALHAPQ